MNKNKCIIIACGMLLVILGGVVIKNYHKSQTKEITVKKLSEEEAIEIVRNFFVSREWDYGTSKLYFDPNNTMWAGVFDEISERSSKGANRYIKYKDYNVYQAVFLISDPNALGETVIFFIDKRQNQIVDNCRCWIFSEKW